MSNATKSPKSGSLEQPHSIPRSAILTSPPIPFLNGMKRQTRGTAILLRMSHRPLWCRRTRMPILRRMHRTARLWPIPPSSHRRTHRRIDIRQILICYYRARSFIQGELESLEFLEHLLGAVVGEEELAESGVGGECNSVGYRAGRGAEDEVATCASGDEIGYLMKKNSQSGFGRRTCILQRWSHPRPRQQLRRD